MNRMGEVGRVGQRRYGGVFYEEFLQELKGRRGIETYREMADNDSMIGAILYAIESLIRQATWSVNPVSTEKADVEWGFSFLLPEIAKTGCKTVWFIMTQVNEDTIGEEMDMWTAEFLKYFAVKKVDDPEKID